MAFNSLQSTLITDNTGSRNLLTLALFGVMKVIASMVFFIFIAYG